MEGPAYPHAWHLVTGWWTRVRPALVTACDGVLGILFAPSCVTCGAPIDRPLAGPVCDRCWASIPLLTPPVCHTCGEPLATWRTLEGTVARCPRCRRGRRRVSQARALGPYDGVLRGIIHAIKYDGRRSLARPLSLRMRAQCGDVLSGAAAIVPVPLHPSRTRERGFNQAADLAAHLGVPISHALIRVRATTAQADLPEGQRHRNVRAAFAATRRAEDVRGAVVVLVDDVSTTGATLEACATVLLEAGVREVRALTAARAVRRRP